MLARKFLPQSFLNATRSNMQKIQELSPSLRWLIQRNSIFYLYRKFYLDKGWNSDSLWNLNNSKFSSDAYYSNVISWKVNPSIWLELSGIFPLWEDPTMHNCNTYLFRRRNYLCHNWLYTWCQFHPPQLGTICTVLFQSSWEIPIFPFPRTHIDQEQGID